MPDIEGVLEGEGCLCDKCTDKSKYGDLFDKKAPAIAKASLKILDIFDEFELDIPSSLTTLTSLMGMIAKDNGMDLGELLENYMIIYKQNN